MESRAARAILNSYLWVSHPQVHAAEGRSTKRLISPLTLFLSRKGRGNQRCVCPNSCTNSRNACPRWLKLFFTSGGSSAEEQLCVGTKKIGS